MNVRLKIPRGLFAALSLAVVLAGGLAAAYAEDTGGGHRGMHGAMQHHAAQSGGTHGGRRVEPSTGATASTTEKAMPGTMARNTMVTTSSATIGKRRLPTSRRPGSTGCIWSSPKRNMY